LEAILTILNPDIILLTETWLHSNIDSATLYIPGFTVEPELRRDRNDTTNGIGGGLLVYKRDSLDLMVIPNSKTFNQYCSFKVDNLTITLVYRPPSSKAENMESLCELLRDSEKESIFIGDFNAPGINWEKQSSDSRNKGLLEAASEANLEQLVNWPTHTRGNVLDLVLTNAAENIISTVDHGRLDNSDHTMIGIVCQTRANTQKMAKGRLRWHETRTE